jgi:hypothetical protein
MENSIKDIHAGQDELKTNKNEIEEKISAMEVKINASQEELHSVISVIKCSQKKFEEKMANKLEKQLKGITAMVKQQTRNRDKDFSKENKDEDGDIYSET